MISTPTLIFSAVYAIGVSFTVGLLFEGFRSRTRLMQIVSFVIALLWPFVGVVILFTSSSGIYIGDVYADVVSWYNKWRCSHESIERCGNYEIDGREPNERCENCGKIWWKDE